MAEPRGVGGAGGRRSPPASSKIRLVVLEAEGVHGDLFLVGGAAMALAYSTRRATRDLDAIFEPKQVIY